MDHRHPIKLDDADFPIPKPLKYTCTHGINHKMRRFCEDVNHFTKHLVQLIMSNKNRLNLPVFVGVFLRLRTSPNLPRSQELTAMIGLLGLLSLVNPTSCG